MATSTGQDLSISDAEWQERINLAACYRLLALYGWDDVISHTFIPRGHC
jgi:hypothetical protein